MKAIIILGHTSVRGAASSMRSQMMRILRYWARRHSFCVSGSEARVISFNMLCAMQMHLLFAFMVLIARTSNFFEKSKCSSCVYSSQSGSEPASLMCTITGGATVKESVCGHERPGPRIFSPYNAQEEPLSRLNTFNRFGNDLSGLWNDEIISTPQKIEWTDERV